MRKIVHMKHELEFYNNIQKASFQLLFINVYQTKLLQKVKNIHKIQKQSHTHCVYIYLRISLLQWSFEKKLS